jgi:hypothetical protein
MQWATSADEGESVSRSKGGRGQGQPTEVKVKDAWSLSRQGASRGRVRRIGEATTVIH